MIDTLLAHEAGQNAAVRRQARHGDADVLIDLEHFLLVAAQLIGRSLQGHQHYVRVTLRYFVAPLRVDAIVRRA